MYIFNIGVVNIMTKLELKQIIRQCYQQVNNKRVVKQGISTRTQRLQRKDKKITKTELKKMIRSIIKEEVGGNNKKYLIGLILDERGRQVILVFDDEE